MEGLLQLAVQSVEWTYSLYWRFSTQHRVLVWGDGFYNGPIKTTKTLHPAAATDFTGHHQQLQQQQLQLQAASLSLQRTHQLRDLYNSLSAADSSTHAHPLRRPSAALSPEDLTESEWFYLLCLSFSFPPGLGLPGKAFAKNKHVWITGANEIDSKIFSRAILAKSAGIKTVVCIPVMDGVVELGTTDKVNEDIALVQHMKSVFAATQWAAPKPALSQLSTSNSATSLEHYTNRKELEDEMDSDSSTSNTNSNSNSNAAGGGEPSELIMQLELSEDIRLGSRSPDDTSNNFLPLPHSPPPHFHIHPPPLGNSPAAVAVLTEEDTHYSNTLSALLLNQSSRWPDSSSITTVTCSTISAFSKWTRCSDLRRVSMGTTSTSQRLLKNILHTVPFLHTKHHCDHNPSKSKSCDGRWLNDKFIILRSIVPFATTMDKASILGDTVEYLKHLRQKIQDLEAQNREFESSRKASFEELQRMDVQSKRKVRILEGVVDGCTKQKAVESPKTNLQVSIIGSEGLLEVQCPYKEGLLLDILLILQGLRIETTAVRSSSSNGVFIAELRAKVKEGMDGKKASILEVKRAIQQIIPCVDT